jgi:hypothetical protein
MNEIFKCCVIEMANILKKKQKELPLQAVFKISNYQ